ncbi:MAG: hypothetical protein IT290_10115 [Deltaproteobacteria bacterium]|nr:hypothetical protein [Deltaproteobacteria bacterium]
MMAHTPCTFCGSPFDVPLEDLEFLKRIAVELGGKRFEIPTPKLCPPCRFRRRLSYRNEYSYFPRSCSKCSARVISVHRPDVAYPVYCHSCWWGDTWSPYEYGLDYDPSRSFLDQFRELRDRVPQLAMMNDNGVTSENCEYTQDFAFGKNCYLVTASWQVRDSMYGTQNNHASDCLDCFVVSVHSELLYECSYSERLYNSVFLSHSSGCSGCWFGRDLIGCTDCFGCVGLRQKTFCFFNEQLSEAEYRSRVASLQLNTVTGFAAARESFEQFSNTIPERAQYQINCEDCVGDGLFNCKNVVGSGFINAQHCRYVWMGDAPVNSYDLLNTGMPEWCYEGCTPDNSYMTHFTTWCWKCKHVLYSDNCHSSSHLFGCIGIRQGEYSILNRRVDASTYASTVEEIIGNMEERGEWGEFFALEHSPFPYNDSRAFDLFPESPDTVLRWRARWGEPLPDGAPRPVRAVPEDLSAPESEILSSVYGCHECRRPFRIVPQELSFYRKMTLPPPTRCPNCRRKDRFGRRPSSGTLYPSSCDACGQPVLSVYPAEGRGKKRVHCTDCAQRSAV